MEKITIATYNQMAVEYDAETTEFWDRFPQPFRYYFKTATNSGHILDLGSGPGRDGLLFKQAGLKVTCLDASIAMVNISLQRGLNSIQADFMNLPFNDNTFDGVWAYTSLLHITKKQFPAALLESKRVLKKGGVLALGLIEGDDDSIVKEGRLFSYYQQIEIESFLGETGFNPLFVDVFKPGSRNYLNYLARKEDAN